MSTAGFFGKIPSRGDFVQRALPPTFVTPWDHWLQVGIASSKETLGDAWLEVYLTSPVWRFALSAHLAGEPAAAGVLIPSVDAAGRYFPFTIASVLPAGAAPAEIRAQASWFDDAEGLAVAVLEEDAALDDLVSGVEALGGLGLEPPGPLDAEGCCLSDAEEGLCRMLGRVAPPHGLFWTRGSRLVQPSLLVVWQLPSRQRFVALLDGAWEAHGWSGAGP
jgi:type VI secretion system protein ImpM